MGNSLRLFGDLMEWTWGSDGVKWRLFGDLAEWTWGTERVRWTFGGKWTASGCIGGEEVALFPKKSHSCGHLPAYVRKRFPKGSHSCSGCYWAYFAHSLIIGTLAEIRRIRATHGNIDSRSELGRHGPWQPGCHSSTLSFNVAACADRHAPHRGSCDKSLQHGRTDPRSLAGT